MKIQTGRARVAAAGAAVLLSTLVASPSQADITRHCRANYLLHAWNIAAPAAGTTYMSFPVPDFTAAGSCGSTVPNRCRVRARDRAQRCMQAHWEVRWADPRFRPNECNESHGVSGYGIIDLKRAIEMAACCTLGTAIRNTTATVRIHRRTYGDEGCGDGNITFGETGGHDWYDAVISDYDVNCPALRQQWCP